MTGGEFVLQKALLDETKLETEIYQRKMQERREQHNMEVHNGRNIET